MGLLATGITASGIVFQLVPEIAPIVIVGAATIAIWTAYRARKIERRLNA